MGRGVGGCGEEVEVDIFLRNLVLKGLNRVRGGVVRKRFRVYRGVVFFWSYLFKVIFILKCIYRKGICFKCIVRYIFIRVYIYMGLGNRI